ncbi:response regulator [Gaetbulibacter saemankumensis]|uniref:response regulator n=1 Tax=Gaetbulibacter saemankumensis TaxID=311208 RepID=UPI0003F6819F|nr:response regulator [Gaetbulibacter saemankumensis]
MDIHMPVMDGWQALKEIRKSNSEVVIFALSANITTQALKMAKESGMDNYLTKPFSIGQITKLLHQYFN